MSKTFEEMTEELRIRINSHIEQHTCFFTAKLDDQRRFHLGVRNVVVGSQACWYYDTTAADWYELPDDPTIDYVPGWCILNESTSALRGDQFRIDIEYSRTPVDLLYAWLNAGINALWPQFYLIDSSTISLSSTTYDYDFPSGADNVMIVETRTSESARWVQNNAWDIDEGENKIHFHRGPGTGQAKLTYVTRPIGTVEIADETDDFCLTTGLPEQAIEAVMLYMEYAAALMEINRRATSNLSVNYTTTAARDSVLQAQVQARYAAFQTYKDAVAMQPPTMSMRVPL